MRLSPDTEPCLRRQPNSQPTESPITNHCHQPAQPQATSQPTPCPQISSHQCPTANLQPPAKQPATLLPIATENVMGQVWKPADSNTTDNPHGQSWPNGCKPCPTSQAAQQPAQHSPRPTASSHQPGKSPVTNPAPNQPARQPISPASTHQPAKPLPPSFQTPAPSRQPGNQAASHQLSTDCQWNTNGSGNKSFRNHLTLGNSPFTSITGNPLSSIQRQPQSAQASPRRQYPASARQPGIQSPIANGLLMEYHWIRKPIVSKPFDNWHLAILTHYRQPTRILPAPASQPSPEPPARPVPSHQFPAPSQPTSQTAS